jgi:hypothetical protein
MVGHKVPQFQSCVCPRLANYEHPKLLVVVRAAIKSADIIGEMFDIVSLAVGSLCWRRLKTRRRLKTNLIGRTCTYRAIFGAPKTRLYMLH